MPITKTIVKKGSRQVIVKTQNQEKLRISVILTILADGSKLAPLIIFKAKDRSLVYNQLQKDGHVSKKECYVECNTNAWSTTTIMGRWFNNIWNSYLDSKDLFTDGVGYLIMDKATSHCDDKGFKNAIKEKYIQH